MTIPIEVHDEVVAERDALLQENLSLNQQLSDGLVAYQEVVAEKNALKDERKLDILRATMRRVLETTDMDAPPSAASLGTKIGTFVDDLYNAMYT
jgi:hypothetical protein